MVFFNVIRKTAKFFFTAFYMDKNLLIFFLIFLDFGHILNTFIQYDNTIDS